MRRSHTPDEASIEGRFYVAVMPLGYKGKSLEEENTIRELMKQTLFNILLPGCSFFMLLPGVMPIAILSGWKPARTITVIMHVRATVLFYQP